MEIISKGESLHYDKEFEVTWYVLFCIRCQEAYVMSRTMERDNRFLGTGSDGEPVIDTETSDAILYPCKHQARKIVSEIPEPYKQEFLEASSILELSPKASAALSRRILQMLLQEHFKISDKLNLSKQITEFINSAKASSILNEQIDAIRNIGNFAAHPSKSTATGEIVEVESGEAEWLLETLEALFDFAFVEPKRLQERKNKLNEKLKDTGKSPMK